MNRVVVTRPICGICFMQVCVVKDATDEEILEVCNRENPSGTVNGWNSVQRDPVQCEDYEERMHFMVAC